MISSVRAAPDDHASHGHVLFAPSPGSQRSGTSSVVLSTSAGDCAGGGAERPVDGDRSSISGRGRGRRRGPSKPRSTISPNASGSGSKGSSQPSRHALAAVVPSAVLQCRSAEGSGEGEGGGEGADTSRVYAVECGACVARDESSSQPSPSSWSPLCRLWQVCRWRAI